MFVVYSILVVAMVIFSGVHCIFCPFPGHHGDQRLPR